MYILPQPQKMQEMQGQFVLQQNTKIILSTEIEENSLFLGKKLQEIIQLHTGLTLPILQGKQQKNAICFVILTTLEDQAYHIKIEEGNIWIKSKNSTGLFYGIMTLSFIFQQQGGILPGMMIEDRCDIKNRGYYLDQSRGRVFHLQELKNYVDRLAAFKINQFQLYIEQTYLFLGKSEMWRNETPLTGEEIMELDEYCKKRYIELVPSLASFGHLYTLLSTKTYEDFCELSDSSSQPFSFWDRMRHHTIDVTNKGSVSLVLSMIEEYMDLFSSNKFNICADETFDLGKGKSKKEADVKGVQVLYIEFLQQLCKFLVEHKKTPMFWGDVICNTPELINILPKETICLNWGYAPDQGEEETKILAKVHANQYVCPGVSGWNMWINHIENSYKNISIMSKYGIKYDVMGLLNTDWGDCGHINHPYYSIPGMIYGACFSWNKNQISYEQINRMISILYFQDKSEKIVSLMGQISPCIEFLWWDAVIYYEINALGQNPEEQPILPTKNLLKKIQVSNKKLEEIHIQLMELLPQMQGDKQILSSLLITITGIKVWNQVKKIMVFMEKDLPIQKDEANQLACDLETWFMDYQEDWRKTSREGDLYQVKKIVFWYANQLRGRRILPQIKKEEKTR